MDDHVHPLSKTNQRGGALHFYGFKELSTWHDADRSHCGRPCRGTSKWCPPPKGPGMGRAWIWTKKTHTETQSPHMFTGHPPKALQMPQSPLQNLLLAGSFFLPKHLFEGGGLYLQVIYSKEVSLKLHLAKSRPCPRTDTAAFRSRRGRRRRCRAARSRASPVTGLVGRWVKGDEGQVAARHVARCQVLVTGDTK